MRPRSVARRGGALCAVTVGLAACAGGGRHHATATRRVAPTTRTTATTTTTTTTTAVATAVATSRPPAPAHPQLLPAALSSAPTPLVPVVRWRGQTAAWIERTPGGVSVIVFDQRLVQLHLHSGTIDAGALGWRYGPQISAAEAPGLVAAFNGGFRLSTGAGGFESYGRFGAPLQRGLGSIVTYADGTTDIGSWREEVPALGQPVASVRQNLTLLVDHGVAAPDLACLSCWGATLGGVLDPARSGLGITPQGRLVWVAGEHLTVSELAGALLGAGAARAVELDINPEWVAGYLYGHRGGTGPLAPVPALPAQQGIPGQFLAPWSRDFFTVTAR
jgi:hypothetical protein